MLNPLSQRRSDGGKFRPESACGQCWLAGLFTSGAGVADCVVAISDCNFLVNVAMLRPVLTRVVNVDIWNIWHMTFTGALLHLATTSWMIGMAGVVIHAAFVYKLATGCPRYPKFL
ncbi:PTS transporter subunit IIC [Shigella flexneri]